MDGWDSETALACVERYRVTSTHMVPTQFKRMLTLPEATRRRYDVSSMRWMIHAAAPCPVPLKRAMLEWWGPRVYEYYAATEGGGTLATPQDWLARPGTVGRPWPVSEVMVTDDDGKECPPGTPGTVYMKMSTTTFEYKGDPAKTEAAQLRDFFTVGDIGYLDDDGFLFLCDRKADMIISGGVNIYPQETEDVLITHPGVDDVAVFGVPNEEMGEEVKAVVQPHDMAKAGKELEAELIVFCRKHLSPIKCPKSIDFEAELPRTPTGKLVKRHLRDRYWPKQTARA
jgi:long-chain acyl-CoA synthetase